MAKDMAIGTEKDIEQSKEDFILDEVNGARSKKHVLSPLNKRQLSRFEMDEMFDDFY